MCNGVTSEASPLAGARESVFFDLDGVLIRSHLAILRCINETLNANGLPTFAAAEGVAIIGSPVKAVFAQVIASVGGDDAGVEQCVAGFRRAYQISYMDGTTLQPGMHELVEETARRVPIAVATTKPVVTANAILSELGVRQFFTVVAGPAASADGENKETTLARAVDELGRAGATRIHVRKSLMVGDRYHDIDAARANGLPVVAVLWGYGSREELAVADGLVERPGELDQIIHYGRPVP